MPSSRHEALALRDWFHNYVDEQLGCDPPLPLQMKAEHSRRVAEDSQRIAMRSGWPEAEVLWAETIGLLHDVGRFSQYRTHQTFRDARSVNHGHVGSELIEQHSACQALPVQRRDALLLAVRHHNAHHLPDDIPHHAQPYVELVRDADKLDIYRVIAETLRTRSYQQHPELLLELDVEGGVSQPVIEACLKGEVASYSIIRSLLDVRLLQTTWVYDLNYPASHALLLERQVLEAMRDDLPDSGAIRLILDRAEAHVHQRMKEKNGSVPVLSVK